MAVHALSKISLFNPLNNLMVMVVTNTSLNKENCVKIFG